MHESTRPVRIATICHSDADHTKKYRRIRLELHRTGGNLYAWQSADGDALPLPGFESVSDAEYYLRQHYTFAGWNLRAAWIRD